MMKAHVLEEIGKLNLKEVEAPENKDGWTLVKVKAAGICGSDIPRIYKTGAHRHPLIPGHEFSGEVVATGKRVGIFPLIPCGTCECCQEKKYEMCRNYNYLGSRCDGGFAEYVLVPEWNLISLPDSVSYETAAMLEPMAVAVHAIRQVKVGSEEKVAVCGLGTIGLFVTMFLYANGVKNLIAIGNKNSQKEAIKNIGEEITFIDTRVETLTEKVDVFFECVGKNETITSAIEAVRPGGRVQLVGNPASDMLLEKPIYWKILREQLTLFGTWNSSFTREETDDWHYVISLLEKGEIHPEKMITHRFPLVDLEKGLIIMRDKTEEYIKVMTVMQ